MLEQQIGTNSFLNDLLSFIDEEEVKELELDKAEEETFVIKDANQANYFAKRLNEIRAEMKKIDDAAKEQIERYTAKVTQWQEKSLSPLQYNEQFIVNLLEKYAKQQLDGSSKKSLKLIEGTLQFRKQQDKYDYNDEILLAALQAKPEFAKFIDYKPSIKKADLKKVGEEKNGQLFINNEAIPGIVITPQDEKFEVK